MAKLSRHQVDKTFYIRTGKGYFGTKQVHPKAIAFLNRRNVFLGDEIPPHLMQKLANTEGWLFTKTDNPEVYFFEFNDPKFGVRPAPKSAVQGTTRVVSVGEVSSPMNGNAAQKKRKKSSRKVHSTVPSTAAEKRSMSHPTIHPQSKQSPSQSAMQVMPAMTETSQTLRSDSMLNASFSSTEDSHITLSPQEGESGSWIDRIKHWYESGGDLPLWILLVLVVLILVASLMLSRVF